MTLGTAKKITLALIEEYDPDNELLTNDEDISNRINLLFNAPYQRIAKIKKIKATKEINRDEKGNTKFYRKYELPKDMYQLRNIVIKDEETNEIKKENADYYIEGKDIYINDLSEGKYVINYYKYPTEITEETPDDFELELDTDACNVLPYAVASDILKADVSTDYSVFEASYLSMLNELRINQEVSMEIGEL